MPFADVCLQSHGGSSTKFGSTAKIKRRESAPETYVVCGATGSIGMALSRRIAATGSRLLVAGRNAERLESLADELRCQSVNIDATDPKTLEYAVQAAYEDFGRVDGIANCVGSLLLKPAHSTSYKEWDETITTNLTSSFAILRVAGKVMRKSGGSVVFVSSAAARTGFANHEAIASAKAGLLGLTLSSAATYASRRIRVNAVAPGLVKSNMTRRLWESKAAAETSQSMHALGRLGEPEEIARLIQWLLSPTNSWVTGQTIGIDGGLGSVSARVRN